MGTRSITTVRSRWTPEGEYELHTCIYRHWDGYPSCHGHLLFETLDGIVVTNGKVDSKRHINGPGRLAAHVIYSMQADGCEPDVSISVCDMGQEFHYQIDVDFYGENEISITVFDGPITMFGEGGDRCTEEIFKGTVTEFGEFCKGDS